MTNRPDARTTVKSKIRKCYLRKGLQKAQTTNCRKAGIHKAQLLLCTKIVFNLPPNRVECRVLFCFFFCQCLEEKCGAVIGIQI